MKYRLTRAYRPSFSPRGPFRTVTREVMCRSLGKDTLEEVRTNVHRTGRTKTSNTI